MRIFYFILALVIILAAAVALFPPKSFLEPVPVPAQDSISVDSIVIDSTLDTFPADGVSAENPFLTKTWSE